MFSIAVRVFSSLQFRLQAYAVAIQFAMFDTTLEVAAVITLYIAAGCIVTATHTTTDSRTLSATPVLQLSPNVCNCTLSVWVYLLKANFDAQD